MLNITIGFWIFMFCMIENTYAVLAQCGKQNYQPNLSRNKRFINAKEANRHSWPWIVNILLDSRHSCGGTLLPSASEKETDIVLTAAHCLHYKDCSFPICRVLDSRLSVMAGNHQRFVVELDEKTQEVSKSVIHPGYPADLNSDIAIIKLKEPIKYSNTIQPICLPSSNEKPAKHETCFVAGWGEVSEDDGSVHKLQQVRIPVPNDTLCQLDDIWGQYNNVFNVRKLICAGHLNGTGNVCSGDSGSPLMCTSNGLWTQYGLAVRHHHLGCATINKPGVFERVSFFMDWISEQIQLLSSL